MIFKVSVESTQITSSIKENVKMKNNIVIRN